MKHPCVKVPHSLHPPNHNPKPLTLQPQAPNIFFKVFLSAEEDDTPAQAHAAAAAIKVARRVHTFGDRLEARAFFTWVTCHLLPHVTHIHTSLVIQRLHRLHASAFPLRIFVTLFTHIRTAIL